MRLSRSAGVVLCIVAAVSFLSSAPAGASPSDVFDLPSPVLRYCGNGNFAFVGETNVLVPCPAVVQGFVEDIFSDVRFTLNGFADFPLAATAELYVDSYIGEPLESVPFFGNGLAQLARTLVVTPFTVLEWAFDGFIYPVAVLAFSALEIVANAVAVVADRVLGVLWVFAQTFAAWFGSAVYWFYNLIDFARQNLLNAINAVATNVFGYFINFSQVAALFLTFDNIRASFDSIANNITDYIGSISINVDADYAAVPMPGGTNVNVLAIASDPPVVFTTLVTLFTALALVFGVIQLLGYIARITESR